MVPPEQSERQARHAPHGFRQRPLQFRRGRCRLDWLRSRQPLVGRSAQPRAGAGGRWRGRLDMVPYSRGDVFEPCRVCRRLQLPSRMEHHEQDNEQVLPRSARPRGADDSGQSGPTQVAPAVDPVDFPEDRLTAAMEPFWVEQAELGKP